MKNHTDSCASINRKAYLSIDGWHFVKCDCQRIKTETFTWIAMLLIVLLVSALAFAADGGSRNRFPRHPWHVYGTTTSSNAKPKAAIHVSVQSGDDKVRVSGKKSVPVITQFINWIKGF